MHKEKMEAFRARDMAQEAEREERREREFLAKEIQRYKDQIVNKDAQQKQVEDLLQLERQRRSAETEELRNLLF